MFLSYVGVWDPDPGATSHVFCISQIGRAFLTAIWRSLATGEKRKENHVGGQNLTSMLFVHTNLEIRLLGSELLFKAVEPRE